MRKMSLLFFLAWGLGLEAQSPAYLHYGLEEGLPSNTVFCALEDSEGYMWFGTDQGLSRFDGVRFKNYRTTEGLPDNDVVYLYEDRQRRLWISCFLEQVAYRSGGRIHNSSNDSLLQKIRPEVHVSFSEDPEDNLWISGGNFYRIQGDQLSSFQPEAGFNGPFQIHNIDNTLLGLGAQAIYEIIPTSKPGFRYLHRFPEQGRSAQAFAVHKNRILYTFPDKTLLLEYRDGQIRVIQQISNAFHSLFCDSQGRFWGCSTAGATCFDNPESDLSNPRLYLPGYKVMRCYEDKQGDFWFTTAGAGIFKLAQHPALSWTSASGLPNDNIVVLMALPGGDILAGDELGRLHKYQEGKKLETVFSTGDPNKPILQLAPVDSGSYAISSDQGFFIAPIKGTGPAARINHEMGSCKAFLHAAGKYWLGSGYRLCLYNPASGLLEREYKGRVTALGLDGEQMVWKADRFGLYAEKDGFQKNWADVFPPLKKRIAVLKTDQQGNLWALTREGALLKLSTRKGEVRQCQWINQQQYSHIRNIKNFSLSPGGDICLATTQGVFMIYAAGQVMHITREQGLVSNDVNAVLLAGDILWAATAKGLSRISLSDIGAARDDFRTALVEFRYQSGDSLISLDFSGLDQDPIRISLRRGSQLEADFAVLHPNQNSKFQYRHVLNRSLLPLHLVTFPNLWNAFLGLFGDAADTIRLNNASYNLGFGLPPGKYEFTSTAYTATGVYSRQPASWQLSVLPYWYESIWVWLIALVLLGIWLWRIYRLRINYAGMEISASQWQLQALRSQINPHFIGNSINSIQQFFYPPDPLKASEYIYLFTQLLRQTLHFSELDFIPFSEELRFNRSYLDMIQLRYGDAFNYEISTSEQIAETTPFPAMILQPVLENATIHGLSPHGVSLLKMAFYMEGPRLCCKISDNGIGIRESKALKRLKLSGHKSKGTEILNNKIQMLNRTYPVQLQLETFELSDLPGDPVSGTEVLISFIPARSSANV